MIAAAFIIGSLIGCAITFAYFASTAPLGEQGEHGFRED